MNRFPFRILLAILLPILVFETANLNATGLYINPPSYFSIIDTSRIFIIIRETDLQRDEGRASVFSGELAMRYRPRVSVRLGFSYSALRKESDILHGVGDGIVNSTVRILGDTLESSGLFLRADLRIPMGSRNLRPFSFSSMDGGMGFELRQRTSLLGLRLAATYTLVGNRCKTGSLIHRNSLLVGFMVDFVLRDGTSFNFSGFNMNFRGGYTRDVYLLTMMQELSGSLRLIIDAALEAGEDDARIFNSLVSLALLYSFPSKKADENGK